MNEAYEKAFINELEQFLGAAGADARIEEINGKDTVVIEYDGEYAPEDCTVALIEPDDGITAVYMLFSLAMLPDDPGDKTGDELTRLVPYLNKFLSVGSFSVSTDTNYFSFSHAFVIDEELDRRILFGMIAATLEICAATAEEGIENVLPVLGGEKKAEDIAGEDITIVQF